MSRRTIAHLITGLGMGGAEQVLVRVATRLDRDRFDNFVVSLLPEGALAPRLRDAGIEVMSLGMRPGRPSPSAVWRLVRLLHERRPDVLQTWLYHARVVGLVAARLSGVATVVWNVRTSDMDMSRYRAQTRWTLAACSWLSHQPRTIVVSSEAGREHHLRLRLPGSQVGRHPQRRRCVRISPRSRRTSRGRRGSTSQATPRPCA